MSGRRGYAESQNDVLVSGVWVRFLFPDTPPSGGLMVFIIDFVSPPPPVDYRDTVHSFPSAGRKFHDA